MINIIQDVIAADVSDILDDLGVIGVRFKYLDEVVLIEHEWWLIGLYCDEMAMWCGVTDTIISYVNYDVDIIRDFIIMADSCDIG